MRRLSLAIASLGILSVSAAAQQVYTAHDYAQAERWMNYNIHSLVHHTLSGITYLPDGRIFYQDPGPAGTAYMIAEPAKGTTARAFDNEKLAAALRTASQRAVTAAGLNVESYTPDTVGAGFTIDLGWSKFHCITEAMCTTVAPMVSPKPPKAGPPHSKPPFDVSPDKSLAVFIRDNNLWLRDETTGDERQLTTDGVTDFGYATDNAGWTHSDAPIVAWSADSKKIATFQLDQRKTGMMYLVPVTNRHPTLEAWHYPLLGDQDVSTIQRVVIDVATAKVTRLRMPPDQHRTTGCDDLSCKGGQGFDDVVFGPDGKTLAFISTSRDHKEEWLRIADTSTGDVREVFHEHADTYYGWQSNVNWKYLPESKEFLWCSEQTGVAQFYLYDLATGKLKNQITHGDGPVQDLLFVDQTHRVLYFMAAGEVKDEDPYFQHFYRVDFDGKNQQPLTPEPATHSVTPAIDGSTFVDIYSTLDTPQVAVVRDNHGKLLLTLARQDIAPLLAAGWKPPLPVMVKARDGKTTLDAILWRPTTFDAAKKYPVVDYVYSGPTDGGCGGSRAFSAAHRDNQSLADLGFVVVCIDGMGNPHRSKAFHDAHASRPEDMADDAIPDQVAGIRELAARYSWIDADRVGVWGHSGGGYATVSAMFHFPDFFKVGWAESGNHDNREYEDDWDERWGGLEVVDKNGKSNYDAQANQNFANNLKGHLMLVHGTMDDNVPPNNTLLVADALIKANKDFDLLMVPNAHHHYGEATQYVMRRRWDYFVKYLAGGVPPPNYVMTPYDEMLKKLYGPAAN